MSKKGKFWNIILNDVHHDKVWMYEEIMTNDDNLESNLLTSSLLKMCCLVQVELCVYCPVTGDEMTVCVFTDLTLQVNVFIYSVGTIEY